MDDLITRVEAEFRIRLEDRTPNSRRYKVLYTAEPATDGTEVHRVILEWNGTTDRHNRASCDCGKRTCVPLRIVRDLERNGVLR